MGGGEEAKGLLEQMSFRLSDRGQRILLCLVGIGAIGFVIGLLSKKPYLAWQSLLVNTVFFGGVAMGGLAFSLIFTITKAKWGSPIKRFAETMVAFIPIVVLLFFLLFLGANHLFEWIDPKKVIAAKAEWLNFPFFVLRNATAMVLLAVASIFYLKLSIRPDLIGADIEKFHNPVANWIAKGHGPQEVETAGVRKRLGVFATLLAILFFLVCTLVAFDWIMSLDQEWYSTMFGAQYAVSSLIAAGAALMIISGLVRERYHIKEYISTNRYHDLSRLTFALCCLWAYLVFAQLLVIWYGNLPEEAPFLVLRTESAEWGWVSWLVFILMAVIPFFGLLSRRACRSIWFSRLIAVDILVGAWLEKYLLIIPSVQENNARAGIMVATKGLPGFSFNLYDISITLGFIGAFVLIYLWFLRRVPAFPIADPLFCKESNSH